MAELILCSVQDAENYLRHFRTKGSKNGIRRWQNEDGSLTPEGRIHYGVGEGRKKRSDLATETENDTSKRQRKMERLGRKIEKTDKRVERSTIKKVKKYDKSKIYAEKADQLFKEYMKYNSKALAMSEKSEAFYKKAERGKKKLEKYRRKLMDLLPEDERRELEHSGITDPIADMLEDFTSKQRLAFYAFFDDWYD